MINKGDKAVCVLCSVTVKKWHVDPKRFATPDLEIPAAYHQIGKLIDDEKLEAFTFQFPERKEYKVVIRGLLTGMPVEHRRGTTRVGDTPQRVQNTSRKTGLPISLFSVLEKLPTTRTSTI
ncbi:hypothetical protein TNCV_339391 [Trichonephila clavipes]|nr:hypothetical protein TNCV_339391 [Trichonephila clavipes]